MAPSTDPDLAPRNILVVAHTGRDDSRDAAVLVCRLLLEHGVRPVLSALERSDLLVVDPGLEVVSVLDEDVELGDIELTIVVGGDGTILRAAEVTRGSSAPLLGVNLGHIGFLAESERDDLTETVERVVRRDYFVEERMTLSVRVKVGAEVVYETWALNEATVEKGSRERMLEVVIEVDQRPLSSFGCDGVVISTPTGSTAYNFSAGGPVVWPSVEAITLVPLSAHALFAKPLVVGPESSLAVEVLERTDGVGVLWCDGRRAQDLQPGSRVVVRRSSVPVRLARLHESTFTDRLVNKFQLPVSGWRGPVGREEPLTGAINVSASSRATGFDDQESTA
ncbi:NAD kinase [Plantibacter flavus]|uniref:NAD kinase n=1 Tax=Plantibacter flavus TaxID=150123 RepID=UPI003F1426FE